MINRIGICFNPFKSEYMKIADYTRKIIEDMGFEIAFSYDITISSNECFKEKIDLLIAFGGDGTVLKAFHSVNFEKPILGINFGRLGFLTYYHPKDLKMVLSKIKEGNYNFVEFPIFEVYDESGNWKFCGINDIVIAKNDTKILDVSLKVDSCDLGEIPADGLVISSQLGSTAYNLSNGGAVISSKLKKVFEISFISPHVMTARPIVISSDEVAEVSINREENSAFLAVDGMKKTKLSPNEVIKIRYTEKNAKLLSVDEKKFYKLLIEKIGWGKR